MARGPKKSAQANSRSKAPSKAPVSKSASKPQPSKGGKAPSKHQQPESEDEESYDESDDENFIALQKKSKHHDSDDEDEQAAFDLNMGDSEDEDVRPLLHTCIGGGGGQRLQSGRTGVREETTDVVERLGGAGNDDNLWILETRR